MPENEIDAIFALKGIGKTKKSTSASTKLDGERSSVATTTLNGASTKASKKKRKKTSSSIQEGEPDTKKVKSSESVVVIDASAPTVTGKPVEQGRKMRNKENAPDGNEEEEAFRDSRGSGPRRRTEEGYLIYKEDELGIKDEGGNTPLCPFDCDCCF